VEAETIDFSGTPLTATFQVRVNIGAPVADFDFFVDGLTVTFTNNSTGDAPLTCSWDFGNNTTSPSCNPAPVTYASVQDWTVRLTVSNALGIDSIVKTVTTLPP